MQATLLDYPSSDFLSILLEELTKPTVVYFPYRFAEPVIENVPQHTQIDHQHWRMKILEDHQFNIDVVLNYDTIANTEPLMVGYLRDRLQWHTVSTKTMEIIHQPAVSKNKTYGAFRSDHSEQQTYTLISPVSHQIKVALVDGDQPAVDLDCPLGRTVMFDSRIAYSVALNKENCYYTHTVVRIDDLCTNTLGLTVEMSDPVTVCAGKPAQACAGSKKKTGKADRVAAE